ncbi:MAG: hypothetical protein HQK55_05775 [Deltaproteobacteria bacterium]|nr:hypothetical protein [Deltaproteobacteria bacterium]
MKKATKKKSRDVSTKPSLTPPTENLPSHYVGIGASAGGLEALETFFTNMPPDSGMAFVVIQHLSPDFKSMMVELLSKRTSMPVLRAEEGMLVEKNHLYLIPPQKKHHNISWQIAFKRPGSLPRNKFTHRCLFPLSSR